MNFNYHVLPPPVCASSIYSLPVYHNSPFQVPSCFSYTHGYVSENHLNYRPSSFSPESSVSSECQSIHSEEKRLVPEVTNTKRPFQILPKNSLELALDRATAETIFTGDSASALAYAQYREQWLRQVTKDNNKANKNMRRILASKTDDPDYLRKRKKNNAAAKRSRDARKAKEDDLAIRVSFLEQEALTLKVKITESLKEMEMLRNTIPNHIYY